jgi:PAS domain S-box-containing protein
MDMIANSSFFKTTPLGIYKTSTSGKIIDANPAFIQMLGFTSFDEIKNINLNETEIGATYPRKEFLQRLHKQNSIIGLEYEWKKKDGSTIFVRENARVIRSKNRLLYYEGTIEDITDRKRTELDLQISKSQTENMHERLRFVDEILQQLTITMSFKLRVKRLATALVPYVSDWCSIDIVNNRGESDCRIIVHKDIEKVKLAEKLVVEYPPKNTEKNGVKRVLQTGKPEIYPNISEELIQKSSVNKHHKDLLQKLDITSMIIVPLSIRQKVFGTLTVASSGDSRQFTYEDMYFLKDIANRASFLIDNARLYEQSQKEIAKRLRYENVLKERATQQAVAAKFGQYALTNTEPTKVMKQALRIITKTLALKHITFAILRSGEDKLMVRFGTGWDTKIVGNLMLDKGKKSLSGYTLLSRKPVVVKDIHDEHRFSPPAFLFDHGITSTSNS